VIDSSDLVLLAGLSLHGDFNTASENIHQLAKIVLRQEEKTAHRRRQEALTP
jgi:hypothetical protein